MDYVIRSEHGAIVHYSSDKPASEALADYQEIDSGAFMIGRVTAKFWWDEIIQRDGKVEVGQEFDRGGFFEIPESEQFEEATDLDECPF